MSHNFVINHVFYFLSAISLSQFSPSSIKISMGLVVFCKLLIYIPTPINLLFLPLRLLRLLPFLLRLQHFPYQPHSFLFYFIPQTLVLLHVKVANAIHKGLFCFCVYGKWVVRPDHKVSILDWALMFNYWKFCVVRDIFCHINF